MRDVLLDVPLFIHYLTSTAFLLFSRARTHNASPRTRIGHKTKIITIESFHYLLSVFTGNQDFQEVRYYLSRTSVSILPDVHFHIQSSSSSLSRSSSSYISFPSTPTLRFFSSNCLLTSSFFFSASSISPIVVF